MKKFKQFLIATMVLAASSLLLAPSVGPVYAAADPNQEACDAIDCDDPQGLDITNVVKLVVQTLSLVIGIAAVIMIMIAGFKYITAGGDTAKITSAKNTIVYAVIGLIIAALAQFIVQFVLVKTTDASNTTTYVRNLNS
jgi:hypothetical protein